MNIKIKMPILLKTQMPILLVMRMRAYSRYVPSSYFALALIEKDVNLVCIHFSRRVLCRYSCRRKLH